MTIRRKKVGLYILIWNDPLDILSEKGQILTLCQEGQGRKRKNFVQLSVIYSWIISERTYKN